MSRTLPHILHTLRQWGATRQQCWDARTRHLCRGSLLGLRSVLTVVDWWAWNYGP